MDQEMRIATKAVECVKLMAEENATLRQQLEEARGLIKAIQWEDGEWAPDYCIICGGNDPIHESGCRIGDFLDRTASSEGSQPCPK